jgi:XTP/dITP diphosphohydrolase
MPEQPRIYIATTNPGKLREFREAAASAGQILSIEPLPGLAGLTIPVEDGDTFEANAIIKAEHYSLAAPGELVLAEDSGLSVDSLGGAPGVYSARYAAMLAGDSKDTNSDDAANNAALISQLTIHELKIGESKPSGLQPRDHPRPSGKYVCVIAIARDGQTLKTFRGEVAGQILTEPRGTGGFGYDPLFYFSALGKTFAELPLELKRQYSHRGIAFREFLSWLETTG